MKTQEYNKIAIAFQWWCAHGAFVNPAHCDDLKSFRRDLDEALHRNAFTAEQLPKVVSFMEHIDRQIATLEGTDECTFICKRCGDRVSKRQKLGSLSPPISPLTLSPANSPPNHKPVHPSLQPLLKLPPFLHSCAWGCQYDFEPSPHTGSTGTIPPPAAMSPRSSQQPIRPAMLRLDVIAACNPSTKPKRYHLQLKKQEFRIQRLSDRIKRRTSAFLNSNNNNNKNNVSMSHDTVMETSVMSHPTSVPMPIPAASGRLSTTESNSADTPFLPPRHSSRRGSKSDILQSPTTRKVARPHRFAASATSVISRASMSDRDDDEETMLLPTSVQPQQPPRTSHMFDPTPFLENPSNDFNLSSSGPTSFSSSAAVSSSGVGFLSPASQPFFIQLESPPVVPPATAAAAPTTVAAPAPVSKQNVVMDTDDLPQKFERDRFVVSSQNDLSQQQQRQQQFATQDTPIPTAIVAVPLPLPAPAWHQQLYDSDPHEDSFIGDDPLLPSSAGSGSTTTLLPPLPMYGHQRSGYEMNDEPSSEFAALHIVENDFAATPVATVGSHPRDTVGLLSTDRCIHCVHGAPHPHPVHPSHQQQRRRLSTSSTGSAPAGYASLPMSASDALYFHKQQQQQYFQQQQLLQQPPHLSSRRVLDRHPDIYAISQQAPPTYVSTGARKGDDSCVIS